MNQSARNIFEETSFTVTLDTTCKIMFNIGNKEFFIILGQLFHESDCEENF